MTHVDIGHHDSGRRVAPEVVVFLAVTNRPAPSDVAAQVGQYLAAGATAVALLCGGDDAPALADLVRFAGRQITPLIQ